MYFLKTLFFNFLTVFFANHILPGINVVKQTKLPNLGGDLPFALALGLLNALIYPVMKTMDKATLLRVGIIAFVINFAAYGVLKLFPFIGIEIMNLEGYFLAALIVTLGSILTNYLEMRHTQHHHVAPSHHEHHHHTPKNEE
jgi:uncharacterized membrane protein YvlD (DUF360 family)